MVKVVVVVFFSLFLLSCVQTEQPETIYKATLAGFTSSFSNLTCADERLSFSLTNNAENIWSLDRTITNEEGYENIRIFLNGKIINPNRDKPVFYSANGKTLFGGFLSENCNEEFLMPQKTISCTLEPVVFEERNILWIETQGHQDEVEFSC